MWNGFVHGAGTGWDGKVELALGFSLVWSGPGIKTFTATGDLPVAEDEPTLFEIWVCADGYWCDHTKNLCPGELRAEYVELEAALLAVYERALDHCRPGASLAELDRLVRDGIAEAGYPGQPSHPIAHGVGARAHEPPYAHQAGGGTVEEGMVLAIEPGIYWEGGGGLRVEDNFLVTADGLEKLSVVPRRRGARMIWTGELNDPHRLGGKVGLYDTTLRDGEQTVGVVLDPEQKLEIARLLDELGIDRIEAGFPRVSQDDWDAVELISDAGLKAEIWGFSRAVPADLEALVELGVSASVIESPISDLKLEAIGVSREKMLERITGAMRFAAEHGIHAAFFGVDSTRAQPDFYEQAYKSAVEAGAKEVAVVDTLGIASPEAVAELVGRTVEWVGPDVPVHFHGHNDFGLATAAAVAAVRAGARWVHGTINGMGERAGNANLIEVALTLARAVRRRLEPAPRTRPRGLRAGARAVRLRARAVEAGDGRDALPARERRGREPVPRPTLDRAVLVRARRGRARDRARQEERPRLDPDQGRRARARLAGGATGGGARAGEGARHAEARPRQRRGVPQAGEWLTRSSSAAGSTRSPARPCSPAAVGTCACSSARRSSAAASEPRR